jgi:hypothetical protein
MADSGLFDDVSEGLARIAAEYDNLAGQSGAATDLARRSPGSQHRPTD